MEGGSLAERSSSRRTTRHVAQDATLPLPPLQRSRQQATLRQREGLPGYRVAPKLAFALQLSSLRPWSALRHRPSRAEGRADVIAVAPRGDGRESRRRSDARAARGPPACRVDTARSAVGASARPSCRAKKNPAPMPPTNLAAAAASLTAAAEAVRGSDNTASRRAPCSVTGTPARRGRPIPEAVTHPGSSGREPGLGTARPPFSSTPVNARPRAIYRPGGEGTRLKEIYAPGGQTVCPAPSDFGGQLYKAPNANVIWAGNSGRGGISPEMFSCKRLGHRTTATPPGPLRSAACVRTSLSRHVTPVSPPLSLSRARAGGCGSRATE
ncbi:unnamed protein product [Lampetra planeri]